MVRKHLSKIAVLGIALTPSFALADTGFLTQLQDLVDVFSLIVSALIPVVFGLGILAFFYGIMLYVFSASTESKKNGRNIMFWALVAVFVMASLFGIIKLAQTTLGIDQTGNGQFDVPTVNGL